MDHDLFTSIAMLLRICRLRCTNKMTKESVSIRFGALRRNWTVINEIFGVHDRLARIKYGYSVHIVDYIYWIAYTHDDETHNRKKKNLYPLSVKLRIKGGGADYIGRGSYIFYCAISRATGNVMEGTIESISPKLGNHFRVSLNWTC